MSLPLAGSARSPAPASAPIVEAAPGRLLLVCMPFQHLSLSSLSVSLLASVLRRAGVACDEAYPHLELARLLGPRTYRTISESGAKNTILGELLFKEHDRGTSDDAFDRALAPLFGDRAARTALMDRLADHCLARIDAARPDVVGFSISFSQLWPSLWLTRLLARHAPAIRVVFGGASCSAPMGQQISAHYPEVDLVVSGYGERPLLDLMQGRIAPETRFVHSGERVELDSLPIPDYEPFLREWRPFADDGEHRLRLAFESSRGCWWGEKHHCRFCGLNGAEIAFHAKSSERVVEEIRTLWDRHRLALFATDTILSRAHLKQVMPRLADYPEQPELFYEVKANMSRGELASLRRANVRAIQPGIESLSTRLLGLLDKGVKAIQNVALLKWCRELGVAPVWNLLYGIPGEEPADYTAQLELIERIPHLAPPEGAHLIQIDRYSPYFQEYRRFGWADITPLAEYQLLHEGLGDGALRDLAYHFDGVDPPFAVTSYAPALREAVGRWQRRHQAGEGTYWDPAVGLLFVGADGVTTIDRDPLVDAVIAATHDVIAVGRLLEGTGADEALLEQLIELGVLWRERDLIVNLVVAIPT